MFSSVDFPDPEAPMIATNSPREMCKFTSFKMCTLLFPIMNSLLMSFNSIRCSVNPFPSFSTKSSLDFDQNFISPIESVFHFHNLPIRKACFYRHIATRSIRVLHLHTGCTIDSHDSFYRNGQHTLDLLSNERNASCHTASDRVFRICQTGAHFIGDDAAWVNNRVGGNGRYLAGEGCVLLGIKADFDLLPQGDLADIILNNVRYYFYSLVVSQDNKASAS